MGKSCLESPRPNDLWLFGALESGVDQRVLDWHGVTEAQLFALSILDASP